jgi:hypothetical protein
MIKTINSSSNEWLNVVGSSTGGTFYVDTNKVQQGIAGQVRHNGNNFEVNDGMSWKTLYDSHVSIDVTGQAYDVLAWAMKKMVAEREAEQLALSNRAVAAALEEYKVILALAEERLNVVVTLAKEHA